MTILVSACLWGCACRYDGCAKPDPVLMIRLKDQDVLPVCPERLGGLPTPRPACSIAGGDGAAVLAGTARVVDKNSADQTDAFIRGARRTLDLALKSNACQ
ncbi:DUF523 domain-containing protein, partial [Desulfosarcina sp. OttesenSCG-928-G10]|nr:DUF523 domain-containing protein [Desulfosarcina sp. OttesenSCG-928-G10]